MNSIMIDFLSYGKFIVVFFHSNVWESNLAKRTLFCTSCHIVHVHALYHTFWAAFPFLLLLVAQESC